MVAHATYDNFQNTSIVWLDRVPSHWTIKRLKFLGRVKTGDKDTINREEDAEYPFFVRSQTVERLSTYSFDEEAVLTAGDGVGVGKVFHYVNGKFDYHQRVYKISDFTEIRGKYLYYYMLANFYNEVIKLSAKSTVDSLRQYMLHDFPVAYGSFAEQDRIVAFLDEKTREIDDAIAKKRRLIALLQEQKAILINEAVTKGLDRDVAMKESGVDWIGRIPAHWQVKRLKYLFQEVDNRTTTGEETLFSLRMYAGLVPHDEVSDRPIEDSNLVGYKIINPRQMVMNRMRATVGLFAVASEKGLVSPDYAIFNVSSQVYAKFYLYLFKTSLMGTIFRIESKGIGTGHSGFLRLYTDRFGRIPVPLPPRSEQIEIVEAIEKISRDFAHAEGKVNEEITLLEELRRTVIAKAVTGKIRV